MNLTTAQLTALKADILLDGTLSAKPMTSGGAGEIATAYNLTAVPDFMVWRTEAPVSDIFDAITWVNFTPADTPEATGIFTARAMVIQTKQMNLQNILIGRTTIDASKANIRAGLRDAVVALPAGASGAAVSAGGSSGATVLVACTRKATRAEKLFNGGNATTGTTTAALLVFQGALASDDVQAARELP